MSKWTYEIDVNRDIWRGGLFDTKEEATDEGKAEAIIEGLTNFKVGIVEEVFNYGIDVDDALERINATVYEEVGEVAEDYLYYIPQEHKDELQDKLNEVFYKWQEKYNYTPTFYKVVSEEIIQVKG